MTATPSSVRADDGAVSLTTAIANSSATVNWTLSGPGTLFSTTGFTNSWTPPAMVSASTSAAITGTLGTSTVSDTATIAIAPALVATVAISPSPVCTSKAGSVQLTAVAYDAKNTQLSATFTWDTADHTVATVDGTGLVLGVANGLTSVAATTGAVTSPSAAVSVRPPPTGLLAYSAYDSAALKYRVRMVNLDGTNEKIVADGWGPRLAPDLSAVIYKRGMRANGINGKLDNLYLWDLVKSSELLLLNEAAARQAGDAEYARPAASPRVEKS